MITVDLSYCFLSKALNPTSLIPIHHFHCVSVCLRTCRQACEPECYAKYKYIYIMCVRTEDMCPRVSVPTKPNLIISRCVLAGNLPQMIWLLFVVYGSSIVTYIIMQHTFNPSGPVCHCEMNWVSNLIQLTEQSHIHLQIVLGCKNPDYDTYMCSVVK